MSDAERDYLQFLEHEGGNADALRLLGALYIQTNRLDRAVACLRQALFVQPENAETLNNLAVALRNLGNLEEAIRCYEEAVQIDPDYLQALDNLGSAYFERGRFDDAIVLHRQAIRLQPDYAPAHLNLANALRLTKNYNEAARHYEEALRLRPEFCEALVNLGITLVLQDKPDAAAAHFERALVVDPNNFRALNNLGNLMRRKGRAAEAVELYLRALDFHPHYPEALINLGIALRDLNRHAEAMQAYEEALRLKPDSAEALTNLGLLMQDCGKLDEAVMRYDEALRLKPDLNDAKWNKALALLALGEYEQGWNLHECGLGSHGKRGPMPFVTRRWDGRNLNGARLLIWSEQGLGDTLQFVRYAALCRDRGADVMVQCPEPLVRLLRNCPFINEVTPAAREDEFDAHVPMMSLPRLFGARLDNIPADVPYIFVDDAAREKWAPKVSSPDFKAGLVWAGSPRTQHIDAHLIDRRRSLSLAQLAPLFDVPGIQFYNLQHGAPAAQIDRCGLRHRLIDLMPEVTDFLDTAAIVEQLDLVITADTAVAHLAGALGKPVWVLSRFDPCWRWLQNREDNPWYPSARIFGQASPHDWGAAVEKLTASLRAVAAN